ncbi:DNA topoisomerase 2-binding protein 1-A [Lepeophtheirus salmonis]|uniref:DNA topoisomerase 2-binding protein 1-A n=1 Tax=Lepeophtheirus salmonis TaxID=72036 RepID=UPI001AE8A50D|nr:DNA topoisomerase 2-binding protein 1-A-like isoform X1 [Lepeophtheirus salmonis]
MCEEEVVVIRFVLPPGKNETSCTEDLAFAFDQTQEVGLNPTWIHHNQVLDLRYSKMDVFVMDPFDGEVFEDVKNSKATLVGPRCLLTCLQKKEPIPELPYPMFTAAMKGLVVTSTGFIKEKKGELIGLIERMSGVYSSTFHDGVTHLVAAVVHSPKYSVAVEKEIPIMTEEWVLQVWKKSQIDNVAAVDRQFTRYACPALMGLGITVSQMSVKDKEVIKKTIESHGGIYLKSLDMHTTNVLIIPTPEGEKYTYAKKWKIPTLNSNWIFDSIEKGHCLSLDDYKVEKRNVSTPTKENISQLKDVSLCSTILAPNGDETLGGDKVNETLEASSSTPLMTKSVNPSTESWLLNLDLTRVKKAGLFLDGCRIYLSGFNEAQVEHLIKVFQFAGAKRMSQLSPSVTHMIIKSFAKTKHLKELNLDPHQVTIQWVIESMYLGCLASEMNFAPPKMPFLPLPFAKENNTPTNLESVTQLDSDILAQYSKKQNLIETPNPVVSQAKTDEEDYSQLTKFLTNKTLALVGLDQEIEQELSEWIEEEGGERVTRRHRDIINYLVLPVYGCSDHHFKAKYEVNHLWLSECFDKGGFVEIEYFFKPYDIDINMKPLDGVVIGITGFASQERQFLCSITEALGGIAQETFARKEKEDVKKSTHLVCLNPSGNKYEAALRWKLPVVSKDWIMTCTAKMAWVSEKTFLIGESEVFSPDKPLPEDVNDISHEKKSLKKDEDTNKSGCDFKCDSEASRGLSPCLSTSKALNKNLMINRKKCDSQSDNQSSPCFESRFHKRKRCDYDDGVNQNSNFEKADTSYRLQGSFLEEEDSSRQSNSFLKRGFCNTVSNRRSTQNETTNTIEEEPDDIDKSVRKKHRNSDWTNCMKDFDDSQNIRIQHEAALDALQAKGIPMLERAGRSFDNLMEGKMNKLGKSWKQTGKRVKLIRDEDSIDRSVSHKLPFRGIKVLFAKKCYEFIDDISKAVYVLGGSISPEYDEENVTHVVFSSDEGNNSAQELKQAMRDEKIIISPDWVLACKQENRLLDHSKYSYSTSSKILTQSEITNSLTISKANKKLKESKSEEKSLYLSQEIAKMNEIIKAGTSNANGRKINNPIKMTLSSTECTPERTSLGGLPNKDSTEFDSQALGSQIQWVDPKESKEQMKLAEKLNVQDCESHVNAMSFQSIETSDKNMAMNTRPEKNESSHTYRFMISGYPEDLKTAFGKLVDSVNESKISFSNMNGYDATATHVIAPKLPRSEKMLCSIASGKMFLHNSYFENCMSQQKIIIPVDKYEWGHPDNLFLSKLDESCLERQLATASYRWRIKIGDKRKGAFEGIVAIIHTTPKRREAFQRLIEFGGGRVITPSPPYLDPEDATHCLAEPSKVPKSKIDYSSLASRGIAVVNPLFINEYIINDPPPPVENYLIEEFKPLWEERL